MADYPDWTSLAQIIGTDIMVAVDIQGGYIMLPVDIQAQYIDLKINIVAQDVTIDIDIEAQSVGIMLRGEFETVVEGTDKNFHGLGLNKTWGQVLRIDYVVPSDPDKVLYICGVSFHIAAEAMGDYDHLFHARALLTDIDVPAVRVVLGQDGGGGFAFPKPQKFTAGQTMRFEITSFTNLTCQMEGTVWGYELDA